MVKRRQDAIYGRGTLTSIVNASQVLVQHDGQGNSIAATPQYSSPAVGDRVLTLTIGRTVYVTGAI